MITAVDSSILLDVLADDPTHRQSSLDALRHARSAGALVACPIVWAEVRAFFDDVEPLHRAFERAGIAFDPFDRNCAEMAGKHWFEYRQRGGSRTRLIADFFIGAHAEVRGARLLTRDRGFFRRYFSDVELIYIIRKP